MIKQAEKEQWGLFGRVAGKNTETPQQGFASQHRMKPAIKLFSFKGETFWMIVR